MPNGLFCRIWDPPLLDKQIVAQGHQQQELKLVSDDCAKKQVQPLATIKFRTSILDFSYWFDIFFHIKQASDQGKDIMGEVYKTHEAIQ